MQCGISQISKKHQLLIHKLLKNVVSITLSSTVHHPVVSLHSLSSNERVTQRSVRQSEPTCHRAPSGLPINLFFNCSQNFRSVECVITIILIRVCDCCLVASVAQQVFSLCSGNAFAQLLHNRLACIVITQRSRIIWIIHIIIAYLSDLS